MAKAFFSHLRNLDSIKFVEELFLTVSVKDENNAFNNGSTLLFKAEDIKFSSMIFRLIIMWACEEKFTSKSQA